MVSDVRFRVSGWLELLRPPNLPTVPGDPLAGFALASIGVLDVTWMRALPVVGTALLLYSAGLLWNDIADVAEDRRDRPRRPLPSERVSRPAAIGVATVLTAAGVAVAALSGTTALITAAVLAGLVLTYTFVSRRIRGVGALNMGLCRGVSLLLGAVAVGSAMPGAIVLAGMAGLALFISAVTRIADRETEALRFGALRWMPALVVGAMFAVLGSMRPEAASGAAACAAAAVASLLAWAQRLAGRPQPHVVGPAVGGMIRAVLPVQAGLCTLAGGRGWVVAAVLLAGWPLSAWLGKRFYAS